MSDNARILNRYTGRGSEAAAGDEEVIDGEGEDAENLGCFGWARGVRTRAVSLELRKKSGEILAIPYAYISRLEFQPSAGITLQCGADVVHLRGRNLNGGSGQLRLFQGITRQKVTWVQEADRAGQLQADQKSVVVEAIEW